MMTNKIKESIAIRLNSEFGEDFTIYTEPIKQGFKEPCFFIKLLNSKQKQILGKRYFKEHSFDVHYFPSNNDKNSEINNMEERLNDSLEYITLEDAYIRGSKIHSEYVDEVLHFFVNYNLFILKEHEISEPMETLKVKNGLKG